LALPLCCCNFAAMGQCQGTAVMVNAGATNNVEIYGIPISSNVIPCVLFAQDRRCGGFVFKDMMKGELKTADYLAVNPWGKMPGMQDGSFCLAESGAILRYLANTYATDAYGGFDAQERGNIDWQLDWIGTNFGKNFEDIWYPVAGFGPAPADQKAANANTVTNLGTFAGKFLKGKFLGGINLNIADYKFGTFVWYLDHPTIKAKTGFELPVRFKTYVRDFVNALSPESKKFLDAGKGFLDSKA